jgi:hypothetical protein
LVRNERLLVLSYLRFIPQHGVQQRSMNLDFSVVINEPFFLNLFMKKLTRDRVVPIISASVSWLRVTAIGIGTPSLPKFAKSRRRRARRLSLELNNWSIRSSSIRLFRDLTFADAGVSEACRNHVVSWKRRTGRFVYAIGPRNAAWRFSRPCTCVAVA